MNKKIFASVLIGLVFISSGCLSNIKDILGNGEGAEVNRTVLKGKYGLQITRWEALGGDTFAPGEQITLVLNGVDPQDGVAPKKVFLSLLGRLGVVNKFIGDMRDGATLGAQDIETKIPSLKSSTTVSAYTRLCYVYKTVASQEFWVVRSDMYPGGEIKRPNLTSAINEGPIGIQLNPSSSFTDIEVSPIRVPQDGYKNETFGIKVTDRGVGFVANDTTGENEFGEQNVISNLTLVIPRWGGNIEVLSTGESISCKEEENNIVCQARNLMLTRGGRELDLKLRYGLEGQERTGSISAKASYRYCLLTDSIEMNVEKQY